MTARGKIKPFVKRATDGRPYLAQYAATIAVILNKAVGEGLAPPAIKARRPFHTVILNVA